MGFWELDKKEPNLLGDLGKRRIRRSLAVCVCLCVSVKEEGSGEGKKIRVRNDMLCGRSNIIMASLPSYT